jgi:hyaluronan synthase
MFGVATVVVAVVVQESGNELSVIGIAGLAYLSGKLVLAVRYRSSRALAPDVRVAVVVPFYNEDPIAFDRCIDSLLTQARPPDEIWVIDDGSDTDECYRLALDRLHGQDDAHVERLFENRGKRHAQAVALRRLDADIVCTVDSDTILDADAIREGLRPFADPRVTAVTGNVRVVNARRNVLTRLTALRYSNAFLWERAAYSALGSVVCCCGSLSFWRGDVIAANLDDYLTQTFLGTEVPYGDDRRLTNYALLAGRVVLQETSIAYTAVPERFPHYLRQQLRWNRSFVRESVWAIRNFSRLKPIWALTACELSGWLACLATMLYHHAWRPMVTGELLLMTLVFGALIAYARSVRYLGSDPDLSMRAQAFIFLLAPLYSILSLFVLLPLRILSLMTLRSGSWGTRRRVEVRLAPSIG